MMGADGLSGEGFSTYLPPTVCDVDDLPPVPDSFGPPCKADNSFPLNKPTHGTGKTASADVGEASGLLSSSLGLSSSNAESGIVFGNDVIPEESAHDTFSGSLRSQSKQGTEGST